jgi:site-specific DNA recombinase
MAIAIYVRISDDRQDGAGVERQLEDCRRLVEGPALEFKDNSISAFSGKVRPQYLAMLDAIRRAEVDQVVVWKIDRLYRRPRELEDLIDLAEKGKVTIRAVMAGDIDLSTSQGRTMARIGVAMANQSSEDTRERVKRAKRQAKENGELLGGPRAFGWKQKPATEPEPEEVALLNQAVTDLLQGASLNDISRRWNAQGVGQPQTGRANWQADIVRQVVTNRRHLGGKTWPAIIDKERFESLGALILRRGAAGRVPKRRSLLTGVVKCSVCSTTMVRTGGAPGKKVWRCKTGHASIDAQGLEAMLVEATLRWADTDRLRRVYEAASKDDGQADIVAELSAMEARVEELADSYAAGKVPIRAFEKATSALEAERRALTVRLGRMTSASVLAPYVGKTGRLRAVWDTLTTDQRREIIRMVLGPIEVTPAVKRGLPRFDGTRVKIS